MAIAYAYNPDEDVFDPYVEGLSKSYLAGRRGNTGEAINIFTGIPHISAILKQKVWFSTQAMVMVLKLPVSPVLVMDITLALTEGPLI